MVPLLLSERKELAEGGNENEVDPMLGRRSNEALMPI